MTKLQRIQLTAVKQKAAMMLNLKPSQICKVDEHRNGATVHCKNGNMLQIPLVHWIGECED